MFLVLIQIMSNIILVFFCFLPLHSTRLLRRKIKRVNHWSTFITYYHRDNQRVVLFLNKFLHYFILAYIKLFCKFLFPPSLSFLFTCVRYPLFFQVIKLWMSTMLNKNEIILNIWNKLYVSNINILFWNSHCTVFMYLTCQMLPSWIFYLNIKIKNAISML